MTEEKDNKTDVKEEMQKEADLVAEQVAEAQAGQTEEASESEETSTEQVEDSQALQELQAQVEALEDKNLRLQAEIANMQRSHSRDRQEAAKYRSQTLAKGLIDAIDNLERALQTPAEGEEGQAIQKGVEMVYQQILAAFKEENIEMLDPINQLFDPNFHQAVTTQPAAEGQEKDTVVNVLQKGYLLNDRIIRPAMVIVSA